MCICSITVLILSDHVPSHSHFYSVLLLLLLLAEKQYHMNTCTFYHRQQYHHNIHNFRAIQPSRSGEEKAHLRFGTRARSDGNKIVVNISHRIH